MDFFREQDRRRANSKVLILFFALAVIGTVFAVYGAASMLLRAEKSFSDRPKDLTARSRSGNLFLWTSLLTLGVIAGGSLYMRRVLSDGGPAVARRLGGVEVPADPTDDKHRMLRNVVEEISIASGTPVPAIYVMTAEHGINAFAAGYTLSDTALGVTQGALDRLNREEISGVVAHEFSHILHGDMRLNIRMTCLLNGILCIGIAGRAILRGMGRSRTGRGAAAALPLLGLVLMAVGYIGLFFGNLIKAAMSRQREFLADASAVQYTRNPAGIAGALKKIGGYRWKSRMVHPHAEEFTHMYFGPGLSAAAFPLLATHPPLDERIRLIEGNFDGRFPEIARDEALPGVVSRIAAEARRSPAPALSPIQGGIAAESLAPSAGEVTAARLSQAGEVLKGLPEAIVGALRDPECARDLVFALLLDRNPKALAAQLERLAGGVPEDRLRSMNVVRGLLDSVGRQHHLTISNLATTALRELPPDEAGTFLALCSDLVAADDRVTLFEYAVVKLLKRHVDPARKPERRTRFFSMKPLLDDFTLLVSAVAHAGQDEAMKAREAARAGAETISAFTLGFRERGDINLASIDRSLDRLAVSAPGLKRSLLAACSRTAAVDGKVTQAEAELLRVIASALEVPIPPITSEVAP